MIKEMTLLDAMSVAYRMRECDQKEIAILMPNVSFEQYAMTRYQSAGLKFTLMDGNQPVCVGGFESASIPGIYTTWMIATDDICAYKRELIRFCRGAIRKLLEEARKLQATIHCENTVGQQFAEHFGYEYNGILPRHGMDNSDYYLYSILGKQNGGQR